MMIKTIITEDTELQNAVEDQQIQAESLQSAQEQEEQEFSLLQNINVDELIELIGELIGSMKYAKDPEAKRIFVERYATINRIILTLIGFERALRKMPAIQLKPEITVAIGFGSLIATGFFIRVESKVGKTQTQQVVQQKVEEKIKKEEPIPKEDLSKYVELSEEEEKKLVEMMEKMAKEGEKTKSEGAQSNEEVKE